MQDIDDMASLFEGAVSPASGKRTPSDFVKGTEDRAKRRKTKEKRAQMSEKQRAAHKRRVAVRTDQINYRCSPEYRSEITATAKRLGISVADIAEEGLALFLQHSPLANGGPQ